MDQSSQNQNSELPTTGSSPVNQLNPPDEINIGSIADIDGGHAEFAPANSGYSMDSGTPSPTTTPAKRSWKERLLDEAKEVGLVIGYLATSFCIIQTFRCATILSISSHNDFLTSYATACVSAVVLGKFVFVIEKMRISKRFATRPLVVAVLYKTALFTIAANLLMHLEGRFLHHHDSSTPSPSAAATDPTAFWLCAFAHQLALVVTFLIFFSFRDIARVVGRDRLHKMFFVSID